MREQEGWPEHAEFMNGLANFGFIILGGPLGDGNRFLHVCDAEDEETVRSRFGEDPWEPGMLETASVEPWTVLLDASNPGSWSSATRGG